MTPTYRPIAGEYRRAIRAAAADCDVATLHRLALELTDHYEQSAADEASRAEALNRKQYPAGGRVAGARWHS